MTAPPHVSSNILTSTSDPPLLQRLRQTLSQSERADIAVGYLFMSGFREVADQLEKQEKIRVLVGRTDRETLEAVAAGLQQAEALQARTELDGLLPRREREEHARDAAARIGEGVARLPQDEGSQQDVRRLRDLVASGKLEIKTYPKGMLHAKAYICWYPADRDAEGAAIVGSSNFTLAGFMGNTELNIRLQDDQDVLAIGDWFENLWADAVDISDKVLVELDRCWALAKTPPYHVYLKALYELYHDELGLPPVEPPKRGVELASFQTDAVRHALGMIDRHGGCFIGDVVGLGKTYIGAEIVRQLQLTEPIGRHPLIVCPAGLIPMWERINELFGLGAEVVSMSAIRPPAGLEFDEEEGEFVEADNGGNGIDLLATYPERGVVLVDEVHNFRNAGTRRYQALFDYLWSGDHKVVLLSATPQNLGPRDIYNELRLFLDEIDHGLDLEPIRLDDYFSAIKKWYEYEVELQNWKVEYERWDADRHRPRAKQVPPPIQPHQPDAPFADITNVLLPVFIRRRRKDIKELYGNDAQLHGKPITFPEPELQNLRYRLDHVYSRAFAFDELSNLLSRHTGARYRALDYLKPEARGKAEYQDLRRARTRVAALTQFLLVKRLESSVAAFHSTLDALVRSNRNFREALEAGFVPIGKTATTILSGQAFDADELLARLEREEQYRAQHGLRRAQMVHGTGDFEVSRWLEDLDKDYGILSELLDRVGQIGPEDDDKLQSLKTFLLRPDVAAGKIIIFSEAESTIDYLFEQLNPGGDPSIAKISGSNRDHIQEIVKRFAPKANLKPREKMPGPAIRVLLASDMVSEGQNLQDCNRVLNYDLHWNPVRLIQRFGRVDRIGTEFEVIHLHNTWPDTAVDEHLDLTRRLLDRIQAFHDMIGLDNRLLSESERVNPAAMFAIYEERRLPEEEDTALDDVSAHQRGINLLQQLERNNPDLWKLVTTLPDGIRSALVAPARGHDVDAAATRFAEAVDIGAMQMPLMGPMQMPLGAAEPPPSPLDPPREGETVVLLESEGSRMAYAVDSDLHPRRITPAQFISAIVCEAATRAEPPPSDTNKRVMAAYAAARRDLEARLGKSARPMGDTRLRRYLSRQLRTLREQYRENEEELHRISILQQVFLDTLPQRVTATLDEMRRVGIDGDALLRRLEALREMYRLNPPEDDEGERPQGASVVRIVCSDGLV